MAKKALLMILDGWGIGKHGKGDVIYNTPTPYLDYLTAVSAHSQLMACGEDVGLPEGQFPICPSGRPTSSPQAMSCECALTAVR